MSQSHFSSNANLVPGGAESSLVHSIIEASWFCWFSTAVPIKQLLFNLSRQQGVFFPLPVQMEFIWGGSHHYLAYVSVSISPKSPKSLRPAALRHPSACHCDILLYSHMKRGHLKPKWNFNLNTNNFVFEIPDKIKQE